MKEKLTVKIKKEKVDFEQAVELKSLTRVHKKRHLQQQPCHEIKLKSNSEHKKSSNRRSSFFFLSVLMLFITFDSKQGIIRKGNEVYMKRRSSRITEKDEHHEP